MKFKKLVVTDSNTISEEKLKELADELVIYQDVPDEKGLIDRIGDADAAIVDWVKLTPAVIDSCKNLKYIGLKSTSYTWFDYKCIIDHGITLTNVPHYSTGAVAELAIGQMISLLRHTVELNKNVREGKEEKIIGNDAAGKVLGIICLGEIGSRVAELGQALKMKVIYYSRTRKPEQEAKGIEYRELDQILREADIVTLHCSLNDETKRMITKEKLALIKDGAIFINTASTGLVDHEALIEKLKEGKISAAIDGFEGDDKITNELKKLDNVILSPHVGYYTKESLVKQDEIVLENARSFLEGNVKNRVS